MVPVNGSRLYKDKWRNWIVGNGVIGRMGLDGPNSLHLCPEKNLYILAVVKDATINELLNEHMSSIWNKKKDLV